MNSTSGRPRKPATSRQDVSIGRPVLMARRLPAAIRFSSTLCESVLYGAWRSFCISFRQSAWNGLSARWLCDMNNRVSRGLPPPGKDDKGRFVHARDGERSDGSHRVAAGAAGGEEWRSAGGCRAVRCCLIFTSTRCDPTVAAATRGLADRYASQRTSGDNHRYRLKWSKHRESCCVFCRDVSLGPCENYLCSSKTVFLFTFQER